MSACLAGYGPHRHPRADPWDKTYRVACRAAPRAHGWIPLPYPSAHLASCLLGRLPLGSQCPADGRQLPLNLILECGQAGLDVVEPRVEIQDQTAAGLIDQAWFD